MSDRTLWLAFARLFLLSAAISFLAGALVPTRTADAKCPPSLVDPNRVNDGLTYHDARVRHPASTPTGVASYILNYSPWVWFNSSVWGWSMLNRGVDRWAQVGWIEYQADARYTIFQYTPDHFTPPNQGYNTWFQQAKPVGTSTEYRVEFRGNSFYFYVDGASGGSRVVNWTPNEAQLAGEIKTYSSQMPGGSNSGYSEWFSLSQIEYGGHWRDFGGVPIVSSPVFGQQVLSQSQFRIWDTACAQ